MLRKHNICHTKSEVDSPHSAVWLVPEPELTHHPRMRSPFAARRALVASRRLAALLLGCTFAGAAVAAALPSVQFGLVESTSPSPLALPEIQIYGSAPARCAPTLGSVSLDDGELDVVLDVPQDGCAERHNLPFALRFDPLAASGAASLTDRVYRVHIFARSENMLRLIRFGLLDSAPRADAPVPENGFWWAKANVDGSPTLAGTGASIEWQNGQLAVGLFGFDDAGAPAWSFGSTHLRGRVASIALVQLRDGDSPFMPLGSQPLAEYGPRLELELLSPTSARVWLVRQADGRDVEVRALLFARDRFVRRSAAAAWSGRWVLVEADGRTPRLFEFAEQMAHDSATFELTDANQNVRLECRLTDPGGEPVLCMLNDGGTTIADFDRIGLDHLSGHGAAGLGVELLRVRR